MIEVAGPIEHRRLHTELDQTFTEKLTDRARLSDGILSLLTELEEIGLSQGLTRLVIDGLYRDASETTMDSNPRTR